MSEPGVMAREPFTDPVLAWLFRELLKRVLNGQEVEALLTWLDCPEAGQIARPH